MLLMMMKRMTRRRWLPLAGLLLPLLFGGSPAEAYYANTTTTLNGSTNVVPVPFPYLNQSDVLVNVNGVQTAVTWPTSSSVQLPLAASSYSGASVQVYRQTSIANPAVVFAQGALNPLDLNTMSLQSLYVEQEIGDLNSYVLNSIATLNSDHGAVLTLEGEYTSLVNSVSLLGAEISSGGGSGGTGGGNQITGGQTYTTRGSSTILATVLGGVSTGDCAAWDQYGNLVDTGAGCGNGGVGVGTSGQIAIFNSAGVAVEGTSVLPAGTGAVTQGVGDASDLVATDQFVLNNATAAGRNILYNGEFSVSQWSPVSLAGTPTFTAQGRFPIDRWEYNNSTGNLLTYAMRLSAVAPPVGYANDFGFQVNTAASLGSSSDISFEQTIEANNILRVGFGTVGAQNLSLSFWVRASQTGTYGGSLCNSRVLSPRCYTFSYTVGAANAWGFYGVTIPADTVGSWQPPGGMNSSNLGAILNFSLGTGANNQLTPGAWTGQAATGVPGEVNLEATVGNTWYMTGAQLEISNLPTAFEHVPPYQVLLQCERYAWYAQGVTLGFTLNSSSLYNGTLALPTTMRGGEGLSSLSNQGAAAFTATGGSVGSPSLTASGAGLSTVLFSNASNNWTANQLITFTGVLDAELY